jgi:hypothetical protein
MHIPSARSERCLRTDFERSRNGRVERGAGGDVLHRAGRAVGGKFDILQRRRWPGDFGIVADRARIPRVRPCLRDERLRPWTGLTGDRRRITRLVYANAYAGDGPLMITRTVGSEAAIDSTAMR